MPAMSTKHGKQLPETHNNGTVPIDEIFYSSTLHVSQAGYLEHGSSLSDHRPIWIDLDKQFFFGGKPSIKPTFAARRLKTQDPRIVARYKTHLHSLLEQNDIIGRTERLLASITANSLTPEQQEEFEHIDKYKTLAMKLAEKHCRKLKMGEVPWTPELQRIRNRIEYLTLSMRRKLGRKVHAITLIRTGKRAAMNVEANSAKQIKAMIKDEYKIYRKMKKASYNNRENYLDSLAEALEKAGKGKRSRIVQSLKKAEQNRLMFRKLARINNKIQDLSTKSVTVKTSFGEKEITDKEELEKAIIDSNRHKYHQTEDTCPFMNEPLLSDFGHLGMGPKTSQALNGKYTPYSLLSPQTKDFIELCKFPEEEFIINPLDRSLAYFTKSWRKMKEKTSSRDLHFGHYKAVVDDDELMHLHHMLAEIPFRTGYSPLRWRQATNVMIMKKQGNTNVDKLRTLVLFECDFNHNNKFLGRSVMHHMLDKDYLATEQYSAPGRKCIDHVINRHLFFDNLRYQKTSGAMSAVDLKSCYDRVSHAPAFLAMSSYGVLQQPIQSMFQSIQHMRYHTFTAHGLSSISFGGKEKGYKAAPNGLGQGNGCAPTAWSVVSSKMFQVMHKRGASTQIMSPLTGSEIDVCGFAYVDDTDLIAMSKQTNDTTDATKRMQKTVNEWEAVSKTTGGALVPDKCWSWIVGFDWKNDNWTYSKTSSKHAITVKDENGNVHQMTMLGASEAKEMLGVSLAPDGNPATQINQAKEKMKKYAELIRTGHLSRHEAWINLTMVAMKSLEYMVPAMTLTQEQYTSIMSPLLKQFLPRIGLNRNIPRDLLYAPREVQGIDVKNPYIMQGVHHVSDISEHLWKQDLTGKLLQCNLEQLRIEIGDNDHILASDITQKEHYLLTDSYVRSTWQFMSKENIQLEDNTPAIPLLREGDQCLMTEFSKNTKIPKSALRTLNKCRLYLQAFTLSDLTSGDGTKIRDEAWHGRQYNNGRDYSSWPLWGRPGLQAWAQWRTALRTTFCTRQIKRLDSPLGSWFSIPPKWKWYSATSASGEAMLIEKTQDGMKYYKRSGRSMRQLRFEKKFKWLQQKHSLHLLPTTVKALHTYLIMDVPCALSLSQNNSITEDRTPWLNVDTYKSGSERHLATALQNGTAIAVSDGSYLESEGIGTASWVLSTRDKKNMVTAGARSPGDASIQSSYRSELLGLLGILEELDSRCRKWKIGSGKCRIFCDGVSALQMVEDITTLTMTTTLKSCDLLSACVKLKDSIPLELEFIHVKGHQDDEVQVSQLTIPAQLNVLMDTLAKNLLHDTTTTMTMSLGAHKQSMRLPIHGSFIHQQFKSELYSSIMTARAKAYWVKKQRYDADLCNTISWESVASAQKSMNRTRLRTITKWCSEWIGTGKNMKRWKLRYSSNCALCGFDDEDTQHILQCMHTLAIKHWDKQLREFDNRLIKHKTSYYLRKAIIQDLEAWRKGVSPPDLDYADDQLKTAIILQRQLGWRVFLEGLVVRPLIQYQSKHLLERDTFITGATWAKRVIKDSWKFLLSIWEFRNDKTHEKDNMDTLEGIEILEEVILQEWKRGLGKLPALEFSQFFRIKKDKLFKKSTEWKKDWLLTVKLGRKLYADKKNTLDDFDTNPALREWIGLTSAKLNGSGEL